MASCGNRTTESGNIGRRVPGTPHDDTGKGSRAPGAGPFVQRTREGPASRPVLDSCSDLFCLFAVPSDPACGAVGAGAALSAGRHTHRRERGLSQTPDFTPKELLRAPPKPTSVTQTQPGGSTSSVERVDDIGRSFPLGATAGAPIASRWHQYLPRPAPCEPHANWAFAKTQVGRDAVTRTSSIRDVSVPPRHRSA